MTTRLTDMAVHYPAEFASLVERMRKLGVAKLGALVLGPEPTPAAPVRNLPTPEQLQARMQERRQQAHNTLFAATTVRPRSPEVPEADHVVPRAVRTQRHANGGAVPTK